MRWAETVFERVRELPNAQFRSSSGEEQQEQVRQGEADGLSSGLDAGFLEGSTEPSSPACLVLNSSEEKG